MKLTCSCSCHFLCAPGNVCYIHISTVEFRDLTSKKLLFTRACWLCMAQNESGDQKRLTGWTEKEEEEATKGSALALKQDLGVCAILSPYYQLKWLKTLAIHPKPSMMPTWSMYTYHFVVWSNCMASANH